MALVALAACGGSGAKGSSPPRGGEGGDMMNERMASGGAMGSDPGSEYAPLDVGADWATYTKLNREPVSSKTHGGRLVDTYVNAVGVDAYKTDGAEVPVGTVIVKTSQEVVDGAPTGEAGPVFVMEKRAKGFSPEHDDWFFGIHWADPPERWKAKVGGPFYWRSPSKKADYCWECHENYDRFLGGIPEDKRAY
jgi:hypothetical protein